jgi:hypothetical protein
LVIGKISWNLPAVGPIIDQTMILKKNRFEALKIKGEPAGVI